MLSSEENMFALISVLYKFLSEFAHFWELGKLKRVGSLALNLKREAKILQDSHASKQKKLDSAFNAIEAILAYKRENPSEFEALFSAMERICQKRKRDSSIDSDILKLWD